MRGRIGRILWWFLDAAPPAGGVNGMRDRRGQAVALASGADRVPSAEWCNSVQAEMIEKLLQGMERRPPRAGA